MNHKSLQTRLLALRHDMEWIRQSTCCDQPTSREDYEALLALETAIRHVGNALGWSMKATEDVNIRSQNLL